MSLTRPIIHIFPNRSENDRRTHMQKRRFVTTRLHPDPTALSRITRELAAEYINIEGYSYDEGHLRLLTDHPNKTLEVLEDLGLPARVEELLQIEMANDPGSLARVTGALAREGVTVSASFSHAGGHGTGAVFLCVDDLKAAGRALDQLRTEHGLRAIRS